MKKILILILVIFSVMASNISCKKYLDLKPDKTLKIPSTVEDLQAVLDFANIINTNGVSFDEASADNYFNLQEVYDARPEESRLAYIWENENYLYNNDWANVYRLVNKTNIVLDNLQTVTVETNQQLQYNNVKGSALFYRSNAFLQGTFIFCNAYDEQTASSDYGMALKLTSDTKWKTTRASLEQTYNQILGDLKESARLLPDHPVHPYRPSKAAAYALLARAYLSMRQYDSTYHYANLALQIKDDLLDYNSLSTSATYTFQLFNPEVIFHYHVGTFNYLTAASSYALVDSLLYQSYDNNDLRKKVFFRSKPGGYSFKGSYGNNYSFVGIATDEVFLMRAEALARNGDAQAAMDDLNTLLQTRWVTGTFVPLEAADENEALDIILTERRKQLIFRSLRWMDIKRLNLEGANISLKRFINGKLYELPPNDKRFALALPSDIIDMTGIPQNPR